jgi:hypothetical protein
LWERIPFELHEPYQQKQILLYVSSEANRPEQTRKKDSLHGNTEQEQKEAHVPNSTERTRDKIKLPNPGTLLPAQIGDGKLHPLPRLLQTDSGQGHPQGTTAHSQTIQFEIPQRRKFHTAQQDPLRQQNQNSYQLKTTIRRQ